MLTKKNTRILTVTLQLTCLGLSHNDTHRLAKRIVGGDFLQDAIKQAAGEELNTLGGKFAYRNTSGDFIFVGPGGVVSVCPFFGDIHLCRSFEPGESFEEYTSTHTNWIVLHGANKKLRLDSKQKRE